MHERGVQAPLDIAPTGRTKALQARIKQEVIKLKIALREVEW
jgi:hypothetical protein